LNFVSLDFFLHLFDILSSIPPSRQREVATQDRQIRARAAICSRLPNFAASLDKNSQRLEDSTDDNSDVEMLPSRRVLRRTEVEEKAPMNSGQDLDDFYIDPLDLALVGKSWRDWEDNGAEFILKSVDWSRVDSNDGKGIPVLVGSYEEVGGSGKEYWSDMKEIREWIKDNENKEDVDDDVYTSEENGEKGDEDEECRTNGGSRYSRKGTTRERATGPTYQSGRRNVMRRAPWRASLVKFKVSVSITESCMSFLLVLCGTDISYLYS